MSALTTEVIALSTDVGAHVDALCHYSANGKLHGGEYPGSLQSCANGPERFSVDTIQPIFRRGVLLEALPIRPIALLPEAPAV